MYKIPPLNALRAFEATARHLSLTKAALELNVTPGAVSHQLRGLEEMLRVKLFERGTRKVSLTSAGAILYPGIQRGFSHIADAMADLERVDNRQILVVSTSPGLTSKWLVPRLYRFSSAHPDIDVRISSSIQNANFTTDGVNVAIRNMPVETEPDSSLIVERLFQITLIPVCSPRLIDANRSTPTPHTLARMPLIHDDTLAERVTIPTWTDWFSTAKVETIDRNRGLHFNSPDHALNAATEGAGVLLAPDVLAHDDLRTGRLVIPVPLGLPSGRCYCLVYPRHERHRRAVQAFAEWIKSEASTLEQSNSQDHSVRKDVPKVGKRKRRGSASRRRKQ